MTGSIISNLEYILTMPPSGVQAEIGMREEQNLDVLF